MSKLRKIVAEELELAELCVIEGGLIGASLAKKITGVSRTWVYKLAEAGVIEKYHIGGGTYFSLVDCIMYRRKKRQAANYTPKLKPVKVKAVPRTPTRTK